MINKQIRNIERKIALEKNEIAYLIDNSGKILFHKSDNSATGVSFSQRELEKMNGNILLHNHPQGGTFSQNDIIVMLIRNISQIRAVTRRGSFIMKNTNKNLCDKKNLVIQYDAAVKDYEKKINEIYNRERERYYSGFSAREEFNAVCEQLNKARNEFRHQWLLSNAGLYGVQYKFK